MHLFGFIDALMQLWRAHEGVGPKVAAGARPKGKFEGLAGLKAHVDVAFWALGVAGWSARSTRLSSFCS